MPSPPPGIYDQLVFVTNYLLAGCGPQQDLIFELNTDEAKGVLMLFVGFDYSDIVQNMFDPRLGRASKPGRHGRKTRLPGGFPDVNELVTRRVHVKEIGEGLQKLPGGRYILPGLNVVEFVGMSAAVIEGVSAAIYDNLAGLLDLNPQYCREFPRFRREVCRGPQCEPPTSPDNQLVGFPGPIYDAIDFNQPLGNVGFMQESRVFRHDGSPWALSASVKVVGHTFGFETGGALTITTDRRGEIERQNHNEFANNEVKELRISAVIEPGEYASISWAATRGYAMVLEGLVMGHAEKDWLSWVPKGVSP